MGTTRTSQANFAEKGQKINASGVKSKEPQHGKGSQYVSTDQNGKVMLPEVPWGKNKSLTGGCVGGGKRVFQRKGGGGCCARIGWGGGEGENVDTTFGWGCNSGCNNTGPNGGKGGGGKKGWESMKRRAE